eukprot:scaffold125394_cov32-Tisochrysis_lutea.AAC.4
MPSAATMRPRTSLPGASGMAGIRTVPSISGASNSVRPTASTPSIRSIMIRRTWPTCVRAISMDMSEHGNKVGEPRGSRAVEAQGEERA